MACLPQAIVNRFKQFCEFSGVACWPIRITRKLIEAVIPIRLQAFLVFFFDPDTVICILEINGCHKKARGHHGYDCLNSFHLKMMVLNMFVQFFKFSIIRNESSRLSRRKIDEINSSGSC